jgi:hypothetical protein
VNSVAEFENRQSQCQISNRSRSRFALCYCKTLPTSIKLYALNAVRTSTPKSIHSFLGWLVIACFVLPCSTNPYSPNNLGHYTAMPSKSPEHLVCMLFCPVPRPLVEFVSIIFVQVCRSSLNRVVWDGLNQQLLRCGKY